MTQELQKSNNSRHVGSNTRSNLKPLKMLTSNGETCGYSCEQQVDRALVRPLTAADLTVLYTEITTQLKGVVKGGDNVE